MTKMTFLFVNQLKVCVALLCLSILLSACGAGSGDTTDEATIARDDFNTLGMLVNLADNLFAPRYQEFSDQVEGFSASAGTLATYCDAIGTNSETTALAATQAEWRELMSGWQRTELFILGPVAENSNALRNLVYSYSEDADLDTCGVDQAVVLNQESGFDIQVRPHTIRGLDTLEYLLFNSDLSETCPSQVVETADWNARPEIERKQWRCDYAQTSAQDLANNADDIVQSWSIDGGNFRSIFVNPLNTGDSLSSISDALFFVDKELKDLKVGGPLGRVGCTPVDCAARGEVESPYSNNSLNNLRDNLLAFEDVFNGIDGLSFDDLIVSVGEESLVNEFQASIDNALNSIDLVTGSFAEAASAVNTPEAIEACEASISDPLFATDFPICSLYGEIKVISDKLKTEFILATALEIPDRAQSDND